MKKIIASVLMLTMLSSSAVMCFAKVPTEGVGEISQNCCVNVSVKVNEKADTQAEELVLVQGNEIKEQGKGKKASMDQLTKYEKWLVYRYQKFCVDLIIAESAEDTVSSVWYAIRVADFRNRLTNIHNIDLEALGLA